MWIVWPVAQAQVQVRAAEGDGVELVRGAVELGARFGQQALEPSGRLDGSGLLTNTIGNPLETTIALSHLIFEGTLDRFPGLKICAAHAGGFLPSYAGRFDRGCPTRPDLHASPGRSARLCAGTPEQEAELQEARRMADTLVAVAAMNEVTTDGA